MGYITKAENGFGYSDPEKTILDFIYIWRKNGISEERIAADVSDWAKNAGKARQAEGVREEVYPKTVAEIATRVVK